MLDMIRFAPWYRSQMRLVYGEDKKPVLEGLEKERRLGLDVSAIDRVANKKVLGNGDYLDRGFGNSYDLNQYS